MFTRKGRKIALTFETQAEYDTVAIALQTRLDEKEYKSREITDSFREFKREVSTVQVVLLHAVHMVDEPGVASRNKPQYAHGQSCPAFLG